ncbi:MAG: DNA translocase FtsK [Candidatus Omnitrophica bacterium]|nr:DNA translocase FtsK [Candidatus Omnitrophota bacterium]
MKEKINKWSIVIFLSAIFTIYILSLISFSPSDFFLYSSPVNNPPENLVGIVGAYLSGFSFFLFGKISWLICVFLLLYILYRIGFLKQLGLSSNRLVISAALLVVIVFSSSLAALLALGEDYSFSNGGGVGFVVNSFFQRYLGKVGSGVFYFTVIILGLFVWGGEALLRGIGLLFNTAGKVFKFVRKIPSVFVSLKKHSPASLRNKPSSSASYKLSVHSSPSFSQKPAERKEYINLEKEKERKRKKVEKEEKEGYIAPGGGGKVSEGTRNVSYDMPLPKLLENVANVDSRKLKEDVKNNVRNLEDTLSDFGISAKVVNVEVGPVITMYELEPAAGIKINKISALADDIALAMKSAGVRVVAPIPGKGTVGIEIPNTHMSFVYLREIVEDKIFQSHPSYLTLALGKDVAGHPLVADLKEMPHLLIAGATGSGKTVCVNSIICSLLFKARPENVRLILVDPKMVELASFRDIPHLLAPIVSDVKKASQVLFWAVEEMEKRYKMFAAAGARNIEAYNRQRTKKEAVLSFIVIIIDELADLMVAARDQIESAILRLAQLSRAAGIHLIMATQRPSVDVVTGVIKANFPARISFKVSSRVDSRTVLDVIGAEKLLGKGDMLFIRPGLTKPIRAQGCFVNDEDINKLVRFVKSQGEPIYSQEILQAQARSRSSLGRDDLFEDAVRVVLETGQASASIIQRRLRVGYNRAARLLDLMEEAGIVGPFQGSKARKILVDSHSYFKEERRSNGV